jgi:hypothetical protein
LTGAPASSLAVAHPRVPRPSADDEHVLWPFDGEVWRDELGAYVADVAGCGRR